jgi:hypothetical protein
MTTLHDSHATEKMATAPPENEIPEAVLMPTFILGILIVSLLLVAVLGFVGFGDLMPRLITPPPSTTFH